MKATDTVEVDDECRLETSGKFATIAADCLTIGDDKYDLTKFDTLADLNKEFERTGKPYKFVTRRP